MAGVCAYFFSPQPEEESPLDAPLDPALLVLTPSCNPHPRFAQEACVTNDMAEVLARPFRGEVIKDPGASFLSLALPPGSLALGDARCHVLRTLGRPVERATWRGTEAFSPTASEEGRPADHHVSERGVEAPAFGDCSLLRSPEPSFLSTD